MSAQPARQAEPPPKQGDEAATASPAVAVVRAAWALPRPVAELDQL